MNRLGNDPDKLSLREKLFFGFGDFFGGGSGLFISLVYFRFLTDEMMIPAGIAGTIVLVTRLWDAVIDPMLGVFSDNMRTRWGRRRPGLFVGGILVFAALALMFMPVQDWALWPKVFYVIFSWIFYCTVYSYIMICYSALSGEISNDTRERDKANTIRLAISQASTLICATAPLLVRDALIPVIGRNNAYFSVGLLFGVLFALVLILVAVNTKERVPMPEQKVSFDYRSFIKPLKIKCFRQIILMYVFAFLSMDVVVTLFQYFMQYVAHREAEASFVLGALILAQIATIPVVYSLTKRISKPRIFILSVPMWILGALMLSTYNQNWPPSLLYVFAAVTGIGVCGCVMMPWLMFPEAVDAGELAFKRRDTGTFAGVMTFMRQLSAAFGIAAVGWVMELTGYDATLGTYGQPASAITGFRALIIVATALFLGLALFMALKNKMSMESALTVKKALALEREGKELPDDLKRDVEAIKPDLIG